MSINAPCQFSHYFYFYLLQNTSGLGRRSRRSPLIRWSYRRRPGKVRYTLFSFASHLTNQIMSPYFYILLKLTWTSCLALESDMTPNSFLLDELENNRIKHNTGHCYRKMMHAGVVWRVLMAFEKRHQKFFNPYIPQQFASVYNWLFSCFLSILNYM